MSEEQISHYKQWNIHTWEEAGSTNDLARMLPAWSIAVCHVQHSGRGRFNRPWIGQRGGLWNTLNVPLAVKSSANWGLLPLIAGISTIQTFEALGISKVRLHWPNDILLGKAKLAGILVEKPREDMASIGIGVNILNDIHAHAKDICYEPIRLADLLSPCPSVEKFMHLLADYIADNIIQFSAKGIEPFLPLLDQAWRGILPVCAFTDDEEIHGLFTGINEDGNPQLRMADGSVRSIPAHTINRLKEASSLD